MMAQPPDDSSQQPTEVTAAASDAGVGQTLEPIPGSQADAPKIVTRIWRSLQNGWKIALPVGLLLGGAAAAYVWWSNPPVYESTATLLVRSGIPYYSSSGIVVLSPMVGTDVLALKTPKVIAMALKQIRKEGVDKVATDPDPVSGIKSGLVVAWVRGTELYTVSFRHRNAAAAQAVVQAVVEARLFFSNEHDKQHIANIIGDLSERKDQQERQIASLRENLREKLQEQTGQDPFAVLSSRNQTPKSQVGNLMEKLTDIEIEEEVAEAELLAWWESANAPSEEVRRQRLIKGQELLVKLESTATRRVALQSKLDEEWKAAVAQQKKSSGASLEFSLEQAALEREEEVCRLIAERVRCLRTELDRSARIGLWEDANLPTEPVKGRPIIQSLLAGLAGLLLPFGLVVAWR